MVDQTDRPKADIPGRHCTRPHLVFLLDGGLFAVEISQVRQISWIGRIWRLPCQPNFVKGVTIVRDRVVTLIDLRLKLGLPEIAYNAHTCVVEVDGSIPVAVVVDSVEQVSHFAVREISKSNSRTRCDPRAVTGIVRCNDRLCLLLDLHWILNGLSTRSRDENDTTAVPPGDAISRRLVTRNEKTTVESARADVTRSDGAPALRSQDLVLAPMVGLPAQRPESTKHRSEPLRLHGRLPGRTKLPTVDAVLVKRVVKDLAKPIIFGTRRIARFRPGDPRLRAIAAALLQMPSTFQTQEAAPVVAKLLNRTPDDYRITHFRYDLVKLRARNLAERIGTRRHYRLTESGRVVCQALTDSVRIESSSEYRVA